MILKYESSLIEYMILMMVNIDVSIEVDMVTCTIISYSYVLLECKCAYDKIMICVDHCGRPMSLYLLLTK